MEPQDSPVWNRYQRPALAVGLVGLGLCLLGALLPPAAVCRGYLVGGLFWLGIALGSMVLVMIYHLTGGGWGISTRRVLEAATRTLPLLLLLFLPLLLGLRILYPWADAETVAADPILQSKARYLDVQPFLARSAIYFLIWLAIAYALNRWSRTQDRTGDVRLSRRFRTLSGPGLVLYGLTITFASVDWVMSLQPHWYSTIFAMIFATGQILSGVAFTIAIMAVLGGQRPLSQVLSRDYLNDLGNILLCFVMVWSYVAFSQFLLIWCGNLPMEIAWYVPRFRGGWEWVGAILLIGQFFLPFFLLLSKQLKRSAGSLAAVAVLVLAMRLLDLFWQVVPASDTTDTAAILSHWSDALMTLLAAVGIGGVWMAMFLWQLGRMPLLPVHDPVLDEVVRHARSQPT